ncbi:hypothetical protein AAHA92_24938 [Salvia divinorum]|uniref:Reverse transcriptase RNase H-like domain-containing protein n=1 Tax=Salvia divinorum TaxID=28513 RepID=A0ABD1G902_SALDI
MQSWSTPKNVTELNGFLGLTSYYRRFVRGYGAIARPLTQLLKKDKFCWSKETGDAFGKLKLLMTFTPVLALPNFEEEFVIETDVSGYGLGAVLMQQHRPLAYLSRGQSDKQHNRSTYEKKMLAILEVIRPCRPYLLGHRFKIVTDQCSLRFLLEQKVSTPEQQRWMAKLMGYDYEIVYRP